MVDCLFVSQTFYAMKGGVGAYCTDSGIWSFTQESQGTNGPCIIQLRLLKEGATTNMTTLRLSVTRNRLECVLQSHLPPCALNIIVDHCFRVASRNLKHVVSIQSDLGVDGVRYPVCQKENVIEMDVPLATVDGLCIHSPTVPLSIIRKDIVLRLANSDDRREWSALILSSCGHNLGGSEMLRVAWDATLKVVAVDASNSIVGLVSMTSDGWIPYVTSWGAPHAGLGSFLVFVAMEWFRLTHGHTVGLSPSNNVVRMWYEEWGFEVFPNLSRSRLDPSELIMRRHIARRIPLLPQPLSYFLPNIEIAGHPREPRECVLCMGGFEHPPNAMSVPLSNAEQLRRHIEKHLVDNTQPEQLRKEWCSIFAESFGWECCRVCGVGFDRHECGSCTRCWYARKRARSETTPTNDNDE